MRRVLTFVALASWASPCLAPLRLPASQTLGFADGSAEQSRGTDNNAQKTALAAGLIAAAAAATAMMDRSAETSRGTPRLPASYEAPAVDSKLRPSRGGQPANTSPIRMSGYSDNESEDGAMEEEELESEDDEDNETCETCGDDGADAQGAKRPSTGKLWSRVQFPEGVGNTTNCDMANLQAALEWRCPCLDRPNCLRLNIVELYQHRKEWRTQEAPKNGGLRDAMRKELANHTDEQSGKLMRSFRVGPYGDCCAPAAGLAKGLSFATFSAARADNSLDRPWRKGRQKAAANVQSEERAVLEAWIRREKEKMEGPKGGSDPNDKWHTNYLPVSKRWLQYMKERKSLSLPVVGSQKLFEKLWSEHKEIVQDKACGHAKCDECSQIAAERDKTGGRNDVRLCIVCPTVVTHTHTTPHTPAHPLPLIVIGRRLGARTMNASTHGKSGIGCSTKESAPTPKTFGSRARPGRIT